jgi:hypothetical protein
MCRVLRVEATYPSHKGALNKNVDLTRTREEFSILGFSVQRCIASIAFAMLAIFSMSTGLFY